MPWPINACTWSRVIEQSGIGTSNFLAASSPRSRSLRSSFGVNVTLKSRLTSAGVLYREKVEPITLWFMNSRNACRGTPAFCASTVISASDCVTTPRNTLWQIFTMRDSSPSPT